MTGFGTLTVTSLVWDAAEGAAKATIAGGHAYQKDSVIEVSGASPAAYNGEHRVTKVSSTEVWFELDGGNPGIAASGTLTMKVAPLGWTLTHESADGMVAIYRPANVSESGNVSLRIDNTAYTGWSGTSYQAKVALVEDVVDINTYTTIYEHRWPATQRYANKMWDLIGDSQLFYWLPTIGVTSLTAIYCFGYIKSVRPGDRYHALLVHCWSTNASDSNCQWSSRDTASPNNWGTALTTFNDTTSRTMARSYSQLFGTVGWWIKGLFTRIGQGMAIPNGADNAAYMSTDPIMVMETGNHLRGYLPGLVVPFWDITSWDRNNFRDMPALPGKVVRFIRPMYQLNAYQSDPRSLVGFDLTGPWR
ncbi:hypothetical protein D3C79_619490 [compost metagenome]